MLRIGLDIDGVLYPFERVARRILKAVKDVDVPESDGWDAIQRHVTADDWDWLWTEGLDYGLFRHGVPYAGAQNGIGELKRLGHVALITARPYRAISDTYAWLLRYGFTTSELRVVQGPKSEVLPHADVYIDDAPHVVSDLALNTGADVICFGRPWNASVRSGGRVVRTEDWREVIEHVRSVKDGRCTVPRAS